jgi:hypothetical protein
MKCVMKFKKLIGEENLTKEQDMNITYLTLYSEGCVGVEYVVKTNLDKEKLQNKIKEIVKRFESEGYNDWSYGDLIEELESMGLIETVHLDEFQEINIRR